MNPAPGPTPPGTLTVIGDLVEDIVVWTDAMTPGTDNPATVHRSRGGSAANVAALAAASVPTRFVGRVGDDATARRLVDQLSTVGVDVRVQYAGVTGAIVIVVTTDGERTMFPDRGAAAELGPIASDWLDGTSALHLPAYGLQGGSSADALVAASRAVRAAGGTVFVDASAVSVVEALGAPAMRDLLDDLGASVVFANREEAAALGVGPRPPRGPQLYIVKDGAGPTTVVRADGVTDRIPVPAVAAVRDTTGAGDAFAAGFLASWIVTRDVAAAVVAGHAMAAAVLAVPGAGQSAHPTTPGGA